MSTSSSKVWFSIEKAVVDAMANDPRYAFLKRVRSKITSWWTLVT